MPLHDNVILVPRRTDLLAHAAQHLVAHSKDLPDLGDTVVLLPGLQFAARLRRQLLDAVQHRHGALLGPVISTPDHWLSEQHPLEQHIPGRARRELMLVEVIQQHPGIFKGANAWQISSSLITLFDELTLNRVHIPDDLAVFTARLQQAYGVTDRLPEPLGMEASLVHRLWQAWQAQLNDDRQLDPGVACLQRLALQQAASEQPYFYFVGFDTLPAAHTQWLAALLQHDRATCLQYHQGTMPGFEQSTELQQLLNACGPPDAGDARSHCLDAVFLPGEDSPATRARACASQYSESPLSPHLAIASAASPELEARAIELQVRRWLLAGHRSIAIVSDDRRLARRVRALLDRANVQLEDAGGWALSTTSAAAVLERWLETVEEDFAHQPLLDVLKSPFLLPTADREAHANTVYRLEQDIMQRENIASGLQRYRTHVDLRLARHDTRFTRETATALHALLDQLAHAAAPLQACRKRARTRPAQLLDALRESLARLGIWSACEADVAGQRVIAEWQLLHDAARDSGLQMDWLEFRAWLGSALERHDFRPASNNSPVCLLTLEQAQLGQYDAVIIAACDREYLPARQAMSPFFNDPVRSDLGLPVWQQHYQLQLQRFRRLLEAAPRVVLSWHREHSGELRMPSPWLEAIRSFHQLGWDNDLEALQLASLLDHPDARVRGDNALSTPQPAAFPRPPLPAERLPAELSVSMHRQLIDCPYKFFAACGLQLKPRDDVKEAFEKAEYGSLVHQILERFHQGRHGSPAAFTDTISTANRAAAIAALGALSSDVFDRHLEDNFEHRAWQRRWQLLIPGYIDWQIKHQQDWVFSAAESEAGVSLTAGCTLVGRLDRIDRNDSGSLVIDYKTGRSAKQSDVDSGEEVQLPSYALLTPTLPQQVEHLQLDDKVKTGSMLKGEQLVEVATGVKVRLVTVLQQIGSGTALPAWGDARTCEYCDMDGLCRKQAWVEQ